MADNTQGSSSQSYWENYKAFWSERFSFLGNYSRFINRDKPVPSWSSSDVEEFIASDPVHGPVIVDTLRNGKQCFFLHSAPLGSDGLGHWTHLKQGVIVQVTQMWNHISVYLAFLTLLCQLKSAREAVQFGLTGSALGGLFTASYAWKYSRSLHGAGLSFLAGGIFGWTFGHEIANHALQLYRVDTLAAEVKFLEWWNKKTGGY